MAKAVFRGKRSIGQVDFRVITEFWGPVGPGPWMGGGGGGGQ